MGVPGAGSPCSPLFSTLFLLVRITTTIDLSYNHSNLHEICNVYVFMFSDICSENFFMYSQDKLPSLVQLSPSVFHYSSPHEMHFYFYQSITIYSYQLGIHSPTRCNHGVKECIFSEGYLAIHITFIACGCLCISVCVLVTNSPEPLLVGRHLNTVKIVYIYLSPGWSHNNCTVTVSNHKQAQYQAGVVELMLEDCHVKEVFILFYSTLFHSFIVFSCLYLFYFCQLFTNH